MWRRTTQLVVKKKNRTTAAELHSKVKPTGMTATRRGIRFWLQKNNLFSKLETRTFVHTNTRTNARTHTQPCDYDALVLVFGLWGGLGFGSSRDTVRPVGLLHTVASIVGQHVENFGWEIGWENENAGRKNKKKGAQNGDFNSFLLLPPAGVSPTHTAKDRKKIQAKKGMQ